jgi:hypothetical protein
MLNGRCFRHPATVRRRSDGVRADFVPIDPRAAAIPTRRSASLSGMARVKLRSKREVGDRVQGLSESLRAALARLPDGEREADVLDAVWGAEGLGMLLWALEVAQLPPYDRPFEAEQLLDTRVGEAVLRPGEEIDRARETARLWHWRARTAELQANGGLELPEPWQSFDQLVGATAMRGFEQGLLPRPLRGDFPAFGVVYRELAPEQRREAHQIAWQRHRALNWLCGLGGTWDAVPTDT